MDNKEISWRAAEYEHQEKDVVWYGIIIVLGAVLLIVSLWQKNFFFGVFVVIAGMMVIMFGKRKPQILDFKINEKGVWVGGALLSFEELESFSRRSRPHHLDELILKKKTTFNPFVRIPLDAKLAQKGVAMLREKLVEEEHKESLLDAVSEWLRF